MTVSHEIHRKRQNDNTDLLLEIWESLWFYDSTEF